MSTVLVCTDVAAMGLDVDDLNLTVNIGDFIQFKHLLFCNNIILKKAYLAQLGSWNSKLDVVVGMVSQLLTSHWFFLREVIISHLKNSTFISELRTLCNCMLPWYGLVFVLLWMTYRCSEYLYSFSTRLCLHKVHNIGNLSVIISISIFLLKSTLNF